MVRPGWPTRFPGFLGVWVDRMRAYVDAHPSSAAPGTPQAMALAEGVEAFGDNHPSAVTNADGTVSLRGGFVYRGPFVGGGANVLTLVPPYLPARLAEHPVAATLIAGGAVPAAASLSMTTGGTVQITLPALAEGELMEVWLDSVTYWPASA